jgi:UrcA family protein
MHASMAGTQRVGAAAINKGNLVFSCHTLTRSLSIAVVNMTAARSTDMNIRTNNLLRRLGAVTLGVAAGLLVARGALAGDQTGTVEVTTSADVPTMTVVGRSEKGAPIVQWEVRHVVRFKDLNLATREGVDALQQRIQAAVQSGCRLVNRMGNVSEPNRDCMYDALREVQPVVDAAISQAQVPAKARSM